MNDCAAWLDYGNDHDPLNARGHALFSLRPRHGPDSFCQHRCDHVHVDGSVSLVRNASVLHAVAPNPVYEQI